jgi:glycosyltransferase involved in cell wall biosynthesis
VSTTDARPAADGRSARTRVSCLPIAGEGNPYQKLMMAGLARSGRLEVRHGAPGRLFAAVRTWLRDRPHVLHYDWNYSYFLRRYRLLTALQAVAFLLDVALVRYLFRCRVAWTLHNLENHEGHQQRAEAFVQRRFARMCDWVRVMSEASADRGARHLGLPRGRFRVVAEGSFLGYYPDEVSRAEARRALGLEDGALVLLSHGALRPYKGVERLLEAFRSIDAPHARLVVAGPCRLPAFERELRALAAADPRVRLEIGFAPVERVQYFFNAADVAVLPYEQVENSSSVILAMGFRKPVVAPAIGVLPERLRAQGGYLYPPGGLHDMLLHVIHAAPGMLAQAGERNFQAARALSWEDFAGLFAPRPSGAAAARPVGEGC